MDKRLLLPCVLFSHLAPLPLLCYTQFTERQVLTMPEDKIQWHPGYEGGIEFRLRKYKSVLEYHHEHPLSKKAIVVDTLVIEKKDDVVIDEDIAAIFLRHNIFEYKNPTDALSIDEYYNLAREEDIRQFIEQTRRLSDADDKRNADAVYEVSMRANRELYERLGRDPEMCTGVTGDGSE